MGTDYNHEIGYESLQADFRRYQKQIPKGVSLQNKRNKTIVLKFKVNGKSKSKGCNCSFTLDGMVEALKKAKLVANALQTIASETNFWEWYENEILDKNEIVDDKLTFSEAIKRVENDFWSRLSRTGRERDKSNPSDQASWIRTYECFYKHLPEATIFNIKDIQAVIEKQKRGTKNYRYVVSAMKKLAETNKRRSIRDQLSEIDVTQTVFMDLQSIDLEEFIAWTDKALGITEELPTNAKMKPRKAWVWAFSIQVVYALRINEVFAIKNLTKPFTTKDGVTIPALNDPTNMDNLIYIGEKTNLGTTVKTGSRIARPQIPPKYPTLIEDLAIKTPLLPDNKPRSSNPKSFRGFHCRTARKKLVQWNAPFTQTHADRHYNHSNQDKQIINQQ